MKLLIDLKNICARQLPKMPKEYIVKLDCDRNHESLVIMRNKTKVIGGICYRLYPTQRFAEIAFLAVTATEQVKVPYLLITLCYSISAEGFFDVFRVMERV